LLLEEVSLDCWWDATSVDWCWWCNLWYIFWEDVRWLVQVHAELPVVDFSTGATIAIFANDQIKNSLICWQKAKLLKYSQELVLSDVELLRAIEVHEAWLQENALSLDFVVHCVDSLKHGLFLIISKLSCSFDTFDSSTWVHFVRKDFVKLIKEGSVVDHASAVADHVAGNQYLDLSLSQVDV
jgi:hypothetical protein